MAPTLTYLIQKRWGVYVLIFYFFLSHFVYKAFQINIFIPCPIKLITGINCLGCGLTRCAQSLVELDFHNAIKYSKLGVLLIPVIAFILIFDLFKLLKKQKDDRSTQN